MTGLTCAGSVPEEDVFFFLVSKHPETHKGLV